MNSWLKPVASTEEGETDVVKPLEGLVVLDLTRFLAGPYCTMLLGGLGAEVIKVEQPGSADVHRNRPPFGGPKGASLNKQTEDDVSLTHLQRSRSKKSVSLNLRHPEGKALFLQLCEKADIVVENYAAGTLERMGFPFAVLQERNARLILLCNFRFWSTRTATGVARV